MQLGFPLPHVMRLKATMQPWEASVTGADQTAMVKRADALGYDMVSVPEHYLVPQEHVELSGPHYFSATTAQAYLAGATERIRINSSVTLLPLQHPVVLAKSLATIDWLSSGRLTVAFGVGWLKEEFDLLGVSFSDRGRMADEYLAAMIELWTKQEPTFEGRYVSFRNVAFEPKPVQQPHPPIWMGGDSNAALRRAASFASGWHPFLTRDEDIPARLEYMKSQPSWDGRPFEVMRALGGRRIGAGHVAQDDPSGARPGMSAQEIIDHLGRLGELGVTISSVPIPSVRGPEAYMEYAQWIIEEVKPKA
jgi:probable F420-dependent oxidoreductase